MTREEQIKQASQNLKISASRADKGMLCREAFELGVEWADANQPSPWISVDERLPEPEKEVIILDKRKHIDIDFLTDDGDGGYYWWKSEDAIFNENDEISHWMPIPQLPKEE